MQVWNRASRAASVDGVSKSLSGHGEGADILVRRKFFPKRSALNASPWVLFPPFRFYKSWAIVDACFKLAARIPRNNARY